jgi:hypothetical protein
MIRIGDGARRSFARQAGSLQCRRIAEASSVGSYSRIHGVGCWVKSKGAGSLLHGGRDPAKTTAGRMSEPTRWESEKLKTCPSPRTSRFPRIPASQSSAPGPRPPRVARTGPPLPGVGASGGVGRRGWPPPWPGAARPWRREGSEFSGSARRCSRRRCSGEFARVLAKTPTVGNARPVLAAARARHVVD